MFFCLTALALVSWRGAAMRSSEILAKTAGVLLILALLPHFLCARDGLSLYAVDLDRQYGGHAGAEYFRQVGGFNLSNTWLLLIVVQLIMFGMGTQMSYRDFISWPRCPRVSSWDRLSLSIDAPLGRDARTLVSLSTRD